MVKITGYKRQLRVLRAREYGNRTITKIKVSYLQLLTMAKPLTQIPGNCTSKTLPLNQKTGEELAIFDYKFDNGNNFWVNFQNFKIYLQINYKL
jgi:hypothetical protein